MPSITMIYIAFSIVLSSFVSTILLHVVPQMLYNQYSISWLCNAIYIFSYISREDNIRCTISRLCICTVLLCIKFKARKLGPTNFLEVYSIRYNNLIQICARWRFLLILCHIIHSLVTMGMIAFIYTGAKDIYSSKKLKHNMEMKLCVAKAFKINVYSK